jgi:hypothetical protein
MKQVSSAMSSADGTSQMLYAIPNETMLQISRIIPSTNFSSALVKNLSCDNWRAVHKTRPAGTLVINELSVKQHTVSTHTHTHTHTHTRARARIWTSCYYKLASEKDIAAGCNTLNPTLLHWTNMKLGRAMAQAVSRRPPTAGAPVRSRVSPCGICGGQSGTGTGFSPSTSVFPC